MYQVKGASGYSKKNLITRAGGANGVMTIQVTEEHLKFTFGAFFRPFAKLYGILKTIPIRSIESMEISKGLFRKNLEIQYKNERGITCGIVLYNTDMEVLKTQLEELQKKD